MSEKDALVAVSDDGGLPDSDFDLQLLARRIRRAGYEYEIRSVDAPSDAAQPAGVYMNRSDYEQWRRTK